MIVLMKCSVFKQLKEWNKLRTAPWKRKLHFVPQKYNSLRSVPAYDRFVNERFQRCLDLYLCPRARKMRVCTVCMRYCFHSVIYAHMKWQMALSFMGIIHCFGLEFKPVSIIRQERGVKCSYSMIEMSLF